MHSTLYEVNGMIKPMREILKTMLGFMGILLVGLAGVVVSEVMKLGDMNALIVTVDNVTHVR
jgi:hypothetical protein